MVLWFNAFHIVACLFIGFVFLVALEVISQRCSVLLHVEDHRPLYPAGEPSVLSALFFLFVLFCPVLYELNSLWLRYQLTVFLDLQFQKRLKAAEADSKLKQVYIPT